MLHKHPTDKNGIILSVGDNVWLPTPKELDKKEFPDIRGTILEFVGKKHLLVRINTPEAIPFTGKTKLYIGEKVENAQYRVWANFLEIKTYTKAVKSHLFDSVFDAKNLANKPESTIREIKKMNSEFEAALYEYQIHTRDFIEKAFPIYHRLDKQTAPLENGDIVYWEDYVMHMPLSFCVITGATDAYPGYQRLDYRLRPYGHYGNMDGFYSVKYHLTKEEYQSIRLNYGINTPSALLELVLNAGDKYKWKKIG